MSSSSPSSLQSLAQEVSISTGKLVGLTIASGGLYLLFHLASHARRLGQAGLSALPGLSLGMLICYGLSAYFHLGALSCLDAEYVTQSDWDAAGLLYVFGNLLLTAYWVQMIIAAFQLKGLIERQAESEGRILRLNGFFTFLLTHFYINAVLLDQARQTAPLAQKA